MSVIEQEMNEIYFHGIALRRYIDNNALSRFQEWLDHELCYELSALAMLALKRDHTAVLCRGVFRGQYGAVTHRHSWVEFKIPMNGWWVADFAWADGVFCSKKEYLAQIKKRGTLATVWRCPYDEFWSVPFANVLRSAIQDQETSHILVELTAFRSSQVREYGFKDYCYTDKNLRYTDGSDVVSVSGNGKPISSRIIQDFVKKSKRERPKARSIRLALRSIKQYKKYEGQRIVLP